MTNRLPVLLFLTAIFLTEGGTIHVVGQNTNEADTKTIVVYGQDTIQCNGNLSVTVSRTTCFDPTEPPFDYGIHCIHSSVPEILRGQNTSKVIFNLPPMNYEHNYLRAFNVTMEYAKAYATNNDTRLKEIAIDDFPETFRKWCNATGPCVVPFPFETIIDTVKSAPAKPLFGVTIYVDELQQLLNNTHFNENLRRKIDVVHLYAHYPSDGLNFESYLNKVKENLPNVTVFAGSYSYDRTAVGCCPPKVSCNCSAAIQREMYLQILGNQSKLLQDGRVAAIEFYNGRFGWEDTMVFNDSRNPSNGSLACDDKLACIQNTCEIHKEFLKFFHQSDTCLAATCNHKQELIHEEDQHPIVDTVCNRAVDDSINGNCHPHAAT